jgi:hypothetical protein
MDLKQYYQKIREIEARLEEKYPVVVSLETTDGGKAGVITEVSQITAAKLIFEGRAALATEAEKQAYREQQAIARKMAAKAELAKRLQVAIIADQDAVSTVPVPGKTGQ